MTQMYMKEQKLSNELEDKYLRMIRGWANQKEESEVRALEAVEKEYVLRKQQIMNLLDEQTDLNEKLGVSCFGSSCRKWGRVWSRRNRSARSGGKLILRTGRGSRSWRGS